MSVLISPTECPDTRTVEPVGMQRPPAARTEVSGSVVSFDSEDGTGGSAIELSLFLFLFDR